MLPRTASSANEEIAAVEILKFTMAELFQARDRLGINKSPGLNGVPTKLIKALIELAPVRILLCMN